MFRRVRNVITKISNFIGGKTGMLKTLDAVTDHPLIKISPEELHRIQRNKGTYANRPTTVTYLDSNKNEKVRPFNTVNVVKIVSRKLAKLVFNEGVNINIDAEEAQEFIDGVLLKNRFRQVFGEELEGGYAVSGLAIVPDFDEATGTIKFSYCSADNFIPLDGNTSLITEAAILNRFRQVEKETLAHYTLFAFHIKVAGGYQIKHELYRSTEFEKVGQQVSLNTIPETEKLVPIINLEGLEQPLFVYIKLAGKNNVNYGSPLGLGVVDNSYGLLCNFNDKYDQYMNEIDTATRQLVASSSFFDVEYDEFGNRKMTFNPGTQVYQKVNSEDPIIQDFSPAIRATEFIDSLNFILRMIEQSTGFSAGTFNFDGRSMKTATEVVSENTDTYQTRADNVLILEQALIDLTLNCLYLADYHDLYNGPDEVSITVDFDDGVFSSKEDKQKYAASGVTMGLMSKRTGMRKAYGLTEEEANEEYKRILEEMEQSSPDVWQSRSERDLLGPTEPTTGKKPAQQDLKDVGQVTKREILDN